jgi:light-harvesting complex I chlorophyll a/b binding protein 5
MVATMLQTGTQKSVLSGTGLKTATASRASAPRNLSVRAQQRQLWYPGGSAPKHLDNTLPGDYGFDPLKLGEEKDRLRWFQQAELVHSRLAMTAAAGILLPGLANRAGLLNVPDWPVAGKVWIEGHPSFPLGSMLFTQILLTGWVEAKRWADFTNPGSQGDGSFLGITDGFKGQSNGYPGGFFDPLGFARGSEKSVHDLKVKEVKNGRLAMLAMLGFFAQYAATGKGPIDNLFDHIADPSHVNFATNGVSLPFVR